MRRARDDFAGDEVDKRHLFRGMEKEKKKKKNTDTLTGFLAFFYHAVATLASITQFGDGVVKNKRVLHGRRVTHARKNNGFHGNDR